MGAVRRTSGSEAPIPSREGRERNPSAVLLMDVLGGGTGTSVRAISERLVRSGWKARILVADPPQKDLSSEVPIEVLRPAKRFDFYPLAQVRRLRQAAERLRRLRPEVLHAYFFWSILIARLLKKFGLVEYLIENREDEGFNWGRHEYALLRLTRSLPDRVVCVSRGVRRVVLDREGLPPEKVTVIHNGIDTKTSVSVDPSTVDAIRRSHGLEPHHLIVGMVANPNRSVKGVRYFVDAIPLILERVPAARFLIVGGGGEESELQARAESLGVERELVFTGFQPDTAPYYELMDLSVLTSLSEGLSMTLLESMKHGLPVVATRVGGNPELVVDGETGRLVPPRDVGAFADRVASLLEDPPLRRSMGAAGKEVVEERFDLSDTAAAYLRLYEEALGVEE